MKAQEVFTAQRLLCCRLFCLKGASTYQDPRDLGCKGGIGMAPHEELELRALHKCRLPLGKRGPGQKLFPTN